MRSPSGSSRQCAKATELAARKVKEWLCMGGRYPHHVDPAPYGNFKPHPEAIYEASRHWPTRIVFAGIGDDVMTDDRTH
jgi:hypothetical protein